MSIGKITRTDLRKVWPHEAHDFTKWLADNIDVLNEIIEPNLTIIESESSAGDFKLDLLAEDGDGRTAVIENQLTRSDHDHLGKLLTYLAAFDASIAIWIVGQPRAEHVSAITWLNESNTSADFYLIKAEAIAIGESEPALLLTTIVEPDEASKNVATEKKNISERHRLRHEFWTDLLPIAKAKTQLHANISASNLGWISASAGTSGLGWNYVIGQDWWRIELYIDRGKDSKEENERLLDELFNRQSDIETSFGRKLNWERLEAKRACRISIATDGIGYRSKRELWPQTHAEMSDTMIKLEGAIRSSLSSVLKNFR